MKCGEGRLALLGNLNGIEQKVSHQGRTVRARVYAVSCPMLWWGVFDRLIEHRLEGYEYGMVGFGQFFCGGPILVELGKPLFVHRPALQHEGFADNQLNLGEAFFRSFKQSVEIVLVGFDRSVVPAV